MNSILSANGQARHYHLFSSLAFILRFKKIEYRREREKRADSLLTLIS